MTRSAGSHRILCLCSGLMALGLATHAAAQPANARAPDMATVGAELATSLNERQPDMLAKMLDMSALAARTAANVYENEEGRSSFVRGFTKSAQSRSIAVDIVAKLDRSPDSEVKFMRVVARGRESRPLLRFDFGEKGFDYVEYVVRPDAKGDARIVDWAPLSLGELYSEAVGRMARIFTDPAPGLIKTLLGMPQLDQATMDRMRTIAQLRRKGDFRGAYAEMEKLPAAVADSRVILTQRAQVASDSGDDDAYRKTLARLERLHGDDPAAAFMLLDHYFFANDLDKCLQVIAVIERRVGVDGFTQMLRANIHMAVGRHADAMVFARKAIDLEPETSAPYFTLAQILVALGRFDEAIEAYSKLQDDFGYEFTQEGFARDAKYAKFIASPQFKKWLR